MKILFLHGWHSVPGGVKPTYLKNHGHVVINPHLDDDDFAAAVSAAQTIYNQQIPDLVVGSSRGGAIAINLDTGSTPLVLLCPAWKNWGTATTIKPNTVVLHSRSDEIIPFGDSEELIGNSGLAAETLIEAGRDHRLADDESLSVMLWACNLLVSGEQLPWQNEEWRSSQEASRFGSGVSPDEASYVCDACGEEIIIPLDLSEGTSQTYGEDCPVCCRANTIHVQIDDDGNALVWAEPEQDYD